LKQIVKQFVTSSEVESIGFKRDNLTEMDDNNKGDDLNDGDDVNSDVNSDIDSVKFFHMMLDKFNKKANNLKGDDKQKKYVSKEPTAPVTVEELLNMEGGSKDNRVTGFRKMISYSELSFGGASESQTSEVNGQSEENEELSLDDDDYSEISNMARMARDMQNTKSSDAHTRSVERILEILKLNKKDATEQDARVVKAIIYESIKKEHPELNNYDRAVELEKRASDKDVVTNITDKQIKDMKKIIEAKHAQKSDSNSNKEFSSTSSDMVSSDKPKKKKNTKQESSEGLFSEDEAINID